MDVTFPEMLRGKFDFLAHDEVLFEFKICVSTGCFDVGVFFLSLHPSQEILSTFMTYILCPGNIEIIRLFLHHGMDINEPIRGKVSSFIPFSKTVYTVTATRIVLVDLEKQVLDLFICHGSELYVDPDITWVCVLFSMDLEKIRLIVDMRVILSDKVIEAWIKWSRRNYFPIFPDIAVSNEITKILKEYRPDSVLFQEHRERNEAPVQ